MGLAAGVVPQTLCTDSDLFGDSRSVRGISCDGLQDAIGAAEVGLFIVSGSGRQVVLCGWLERWGATGDGCNKVVGKGVTQGTVWLELLA